MKVRSKIAKTCLLSALLSTTALVSTGALAQMVTKAPPAPADQYPWWFEGTVEVGGRGFTDAPGYRGSGAANANNWQEGQNLGGYYRYSDVAPGAFGNFDLSTGSKDGLYRIDAGGRNVGYRDQSYYFDASKAGEHYFNFYWDQSPHLYSTTAQSPYFITGNMVNLPAGAAAIVIGNAPNNTFPANTAGGALYPYAVYQNLGITRDTAAASYRWTPTDAWDFNADYSHMDRKGEQVVGEYKGVVQNNQLTLKPVNDTTQNYDAKGQWVGTSPWGQRLVIQAGYEGSSYHDDFNQYMVEALSTNAVAAKAGTVQQPAFGAGSRWSVFSAWPSNHSDAFVSNASADLPWNSRYTGTLNYSTIGQNMAFPVGDDYNNLAAGCFYGATNPPNVGNGTTCTSGVPAALANGATGLNGRIDTLLSNNVITTKIDPTLTAKTSLRYYDVDNRTSEQEVLANNGQGFDNATALAMSYIKTNIGEELDWRPSKYWNIGTQYDFEHYNWTRADASTTNQSSVKVFADYMPFTWLTSRASGEFSSRRYSNYDYLGLVGSVQWGPAASATPTGCNPVSGACSLEYWESYRQFMFDNRQVWTGHYSLDVVVAPGFTLTPWTKYTNQSYSVDPNFQDGLVSSSRWDSGIDATWVATPQLSFTVGYSWDFQKAWAVAPCLAGGGNVGTPTTSLAGQVCSITQPNGTVLTPAAYQITTSDTQTQGFVTLGVKYTPTEQWDLSLRYAGSLAEDNMKMYPPVPAAGATVAPFTTAAPGIGNANGQYIPDKVWFSRLDATAVYKFSPEQVAALGWKGTIKVKLNYAWERNSESNWQNDPLSPFVPYSPGIGTATTADVWMGWYNPNYNVQMISGSLIASW